MTDSALDRLVIDTIGTLSIDAVRAARSGRPGSPKALAPFACTLWSRLLRSDPKDPIWPSRDRLVLSIGRASIEADQFLLVVHGAVEDAQKAKRIPGGGGAASTTLHLG